MSESTLSITRLELKTAVRRYLAYADTGTLETDQDNAVSAIVEAGENMFYKGTRLPGEQTIHRWSFLSPVYGFTVVAADYTYDCPDDWGGFASPTPVASGNSYSPSIRVIPVDTLLELRERNSDLTAEFPLNLAQRCKARDQTTGQRYELLLYPTPSTGFTLSVKYVSNPAAISNDSYYPLGGQPHALTLLQACLAAAELRENDGAEGVQFREFMRLMTDSVAFDRAVATPSFFGQNLDRSIPCGSFRRHRGRGVTYEGEV